MNITETRVFTKTEALKEIGMPNLVEEGGAFQIDDFIYAIPIETPSGTKYAKVSLTFATDKDVKYKTGKIIKAFNLETALSEYEKKVEAREQKEAERRVKKKMG